MNHRSILLAAVACAMALPPATAFAKPPPWAPAHGYRAKTGSIVYRTTDNGVRYWKGNDGRYYCRRSDGTVGLLAGAALGALIGRAIDTKGERATGTILGAAAGALVGNELAKGPTRCDRRG
ncbi:glycine zipper 2TM domain-containing protein [Novosphingobium sp.]|uniref:glycine zipper 2TM domain-containing protein n=1 Tax=Novosphingobium sp. TaxID=1874826 RepID=UPI0035B1A1EF